MDSNLFEAIKFTILSVENEEHIPEFLLTRSDIQFDFTCQLHE